MTDEEFEAELRKLADSSTPDEAWKYHYKRIYNKYHKYKRTREYKTELYERFQDENKMLLTKISNLETTIQQLVTLLNSGKK